MTNDFNRDNFEGQEIPYDLRQKYAEIIGISLTKIFMAREERDYQKWFSLLNDLHTEIHQKLKPDEREEYNTKLNECVGELNKNSNAFKGLDKDAEKNYKVYLALKKLELWLRDMMEKHNMFGSKRDVEGLF